MHGHCSWTSRPFRFCLFIFMTHLGPVNLANQNYIYIYIYIFFFLYNTYILLKILFWDDRGHVLLKNLEVTPWFDMVLSLQVRTNKKLSI